MTTEPRACVLRIILWLTVRFLSSRIVLRVLGKKLFCESAFLTLVYNLSSKFYAYAIQLNEWTLPVNSHRPRGDK